ncbi:MAG: hypothetical protein Q9168_007568 [Polycauliona sp. 1 TL-2023]
MNVMTAYVSNNASDERHARKIWTRLTICAGACYTNDAYHRPRPIFCRIGSPMFKRSYNPIQAVKAHQNPSYQSYHCEFSSTELANFPVAEMLSHPVICFLLYLFVAGTAAENSTDKFGTTYHTKALPSILVEPADHAQYFCTSSRDWVTDTFDADDCPGVLQLVQDIELATKRTTVYEFVEANDTSRILSPVYYHQETPRKYVYSR